MKLSSNNQKNEIEKDETDFDVVIIGAGLSGLTAANRLISTGLNTLLIEKNGGRLLSARHSKSYYAHESQYNVNKLMRQLNLTKRSEKSSESRKLIYCKPTALQSNIPFYIVGEIHYFVKIIDDFSKNNTFTILTEAMNITTFLNITVKDILHNLVFFEKSRSICRILIYITCGVHQLEEISGLWYLRMLSGAGGFLQRLRINLGDSDRYYIPVKSSTGGAMHVAQLLTNKIEIEGKIHYGEEVLKIQFSDDRAHVWSESNHYKCNYVIFTVPFTNDCRVIIEPDLPCCLKQTQTGNRNTFFNAICELPNEYDNVKNIIICGGTAENFNLIYDATCLEDKHRHFSGYLTTEINRNILAITEIIKKYCACRILEFDEFMVGNGNVMNVFNPRYWRNNCMLLQNHGRVIVAGSEYATQWPGTLDGAIESGELAAFSILQRMRPQSMDRFEWMMYE